MEPAVGWWSEVTLRREPNKNPQGLSTIGRSEYMWNIYITWTLCFLAGLWVFRCVVTCDWSEPVHSACKTPVVVKECMLTARTTTWPQKACPHCHLSKCCSVCAESGAPCPCFSLLRHLLHQIHLGSGVFGRAGWSTEEQTDAKVNEASAESNKMQQ